MADSSESGGCFGSLASEPNNRSYRNEPEFSLSNWQCTSIACGKAVTAWPRATVDLTNGLLPALATLPAIAFLAVVHGAVLPALFAAWLVRRKCYRADRGR